MKPNIELILDSVTGEVVQTRGLIPGQVLHISLTNQHGEWREILIRRFGDEHQIKYVDH